MFLSLSSALVYFSIDTASVHCGSGVEEKSAVSGKKISLAPYVQGQSSR